MGSRPGSVIAVNRILAATWCATNENSQGVFSHAQLLDGPQALFHRLRAGSPLRSHRYRGRTRQTLLAHQLHILLININNVLDGLRLTAALNGLRHRIPVRTQICCVQFIALVLGQCGIPARYVDAFHRTGQACSWRLVRAR